MIWDERFNAIFPARITDATDVDDVWAHSWVEQFVDPVTGQLADADPPRTGSSTDSPAYEINNVRCPDGATVWMKTRGVGLDNQIVYEFIHPQTTVFVKVVSEQDAWPMYNGSIQTFSARTRAWTTFGDCYLIEANRDELVTGRRYKANLVGQYGGDPLYSTFCCGDPPPPDPVNPLCSDETPVAWTVLPFSNPMSDCTSFNGGFVLYWNSGTSKWEYVSGSLSVTIEFDEAEEEAILTFQDGASYSIYKAPFVIIDGVLNCCNYTWGFVFDDTNCLGGDGVVQARPHCQNPCACDSLCVNDGAKFSGVYCIEFSSVSGSGVLDGVRAGGYVGRFDYCISNGVSFGQGQPWQLLYYVGGEPWSSGAVGFIADVFTQGVGWTDTPVHANWQFYCDSDTQEFVFLFGCHSSWSQNPVDQFGPVTEALPRTTMTGSLLSHTCDPPSLVFRGTVSADFDGVCGNEGDVYDITYTKVSSFFDCPAGVHFCNYCSDYFYPLYWDFEITGVTGDYEGLNGERRVMKAFGTQCIFSRNYIDGRALDFPNYSDYTNLFRFYFEMQYDKLVLVVLLHNSYHVTTLIPDGYLSYSLDPVTSPYDCCSPVTLTLVDSENVDNAPATLTLTPSCGVSPPNCPSCSLQVPSLFTFTLSTFTGDCTAYNGNYALRRVGETCTYAYYARRVAIVLELLPTSVLLTGNINGVEISYSVTGLDEPYDCCAGFLLSSVDVTDCASAPATLTVVPACFTPTCDNCDAELPDSWEVVIAGMTGDFTKYNGTWTLVAATDCTWRAYSGSVDLYLRVRDDAVELFTESGGNFLYSLAGTAPWDCCVPHELDKDTTFGTGDTPSTLTVTPSCYLAPCDHCDDTPATITVTFSGGSDGCEVYAGDWVFNHDGGCQWTATLGGRTLVWTLESNGEFWIENAEMEWYGSAGAAPVACCNESMWEATILNNATTLCASPTSMPTVTNVVVGGCPGA